MLRALASVGVFVEDEAGCFRLSPLAEPLRTDTPGSLRAFAIMLGEPEHWRAWEGVLHSVRTGNPHSTMSSAYRCFSISRHIQKPHGSLMTR